MVCQAVLLAIPRDLEQRMTYLIEPFPPNIRFFFFLIMHASGLPPLPHPDEYFRAPFVAL